MVHPLHSTPSSQMILKENHVQPGDCKSGDHFISPDPGRVISSSGHMVLFANHQLTTTASNTIRGKLLFEREAADVSVSVKQYHSDNGVFGSAEFCSHCQELGQTMRFSGVGAHHQYGIAERAIRTVTNMARVNMLHATLHWSERSFIDLWPLAMNYAVWVYNRLPQHGAGLSPKELFSGIKFPRSGLPCAHVFGSPVYVLDPCLQDGKKIPKWDSRARQGIFVEFSIRHSSLSSRFESTHTTHFTSIPCHF
eukprot:CCRYP_020926-RA/>CCRYP_020926-RA protein AED:0.37 eAED:0.37 QI:0/0/0/1/0/0/2/0/251